MSETMSANARALAEARLWIGAPYLHQGSDREQGTDCLGLVRAIWRSLYGREPEQVSAYSSDWAEVGSEERLLAAAGRWLIPAEQARAGDVLVFRMSPAAMAKHCAIVSEAPGGGSAGRIIHAYWGRAVIESFMSDWWWQRVAGVFRWPEGHNQGEAH